jgi:uncharacterized protein YndB with AHSA1/START domain
METTTETVIEREVEIEASPATVWEFLADPEKLARWFGSRASLDPRPGGEYRVDGIVGHVASGEFVELDPPRRLVHTFGWEPEGGKENPVPPGSSTIEIELEPSGDGTLLKFRHYGLPDADAVRQHSFGWDHYLARLVIAGAGGDPGEDRVPEMH